MQKVTSQIFLFYCLIQGEAKAQSRLLLSQAAAMFFDLLGEEEEEVYYTKLGKPYFPSLRYFLSVTHADSFYAVCFAPFPVGLDAERKDVFHPRVQALFTPEEKKLSFSRVWTAKEAVAKLDGRGLAILKKIKVFPKEAFLEGEKYVLLSQEMEGYVVTVAEKEGEENAAQAISEK